MMEKPQQTGPEHPLAPDGTLPSSATRATNTIKGAISSDPFIVAMLEQMPKDLAATFSDAQLLQLKLLFGTRAKARHSIDYRTTLGFFGWHYYLVFLFGRNRRALSASEEKLSATARLFRIAVGSLILVSVIFLSLYLLKSFLGIDLFPGFSLGIWHSLTT